MRTHNIAVCQACIRRAPEVHSLCVQSERNRQYYEDEFGERGEPLVSIRALPAVSSATQETRAEKQQRLAMLAPDSVIS